MLNFSCEYKTKNVHYKFDSNLNLTKDGEQIDVAYENFGIKEAVGLAKVLTETIEKNKKDIFKNTTFDEVVENVKLIEKARHSLIKVRLCNISYGRGNRKENLKDEINRLINDFYRGKSYYKFEEGISISESIVLNNLTDSRFFRSESYSDFIDKYDCLKQDKTKINSLYKEMTSFPYGKYGLENIVIKDSIKKCLDFANKIISSYEMILDNAGDDILSWSQQKISRMLNSSEFKGVSYWNISGWLDEKREQLKSKGVKPKEVKPKVNKVDALKNKLECELTQDDLLRLFKEGHKLNLVISNMNLETLNLVFSSPLKCIKKHYLDRWNNLNSEVGNELINRFCDIAPKDKVSLDTITSFIKINKGDIRKIKEDYFFGCEDILDKNLILEYIFHKELEITPAFYDKFLKDMDYQTILNLNSSVTKEFVSRLSEEEKVSILPRLFGKFLNTDNVPLNYIFSDYAWDNLKEIYYSKKDTTDLYNDVNWNLIRKEVLDNVKIRVKVIPLIIKNNDLEIAEVLARKDFRDISKEERGSLLSMFDVDNQIDIISTCSQGNQYHGNYIDNISDIINSEKDLVKLFKESIVKSDSRFLVSSIINLAHDRKYNLELFRETIVKTEIGKYPLTHYSLKILDKKTKLHLLKENVDFTTFSENTYHYRSSYTNSEIEEFFKGLNRKDLEAIYGSDLSECKYYMYLNHLMTNEERIRCCEQDSKFLRQHLKDIPYSYLKQFEDKNKFKEIVGDRRKTENDNFGSRLERIFKEQLTQALDKPTSVKLMFE